MEAAGYRIDGALGEGGMGTVYRATQLSLERVVALKVLTVELSSDAGFRERFRREGLQQAALGLVPALGLCAAAWRRTRPRSWCASCNCTGSMCMW